MLFVSADSFLFSLSAASKHKIANIPFKKQIAAGFCGPACLQILLEYYGEEDFDQLDIAKLMVKLFPNEERIKKSGLLKKQFKKGRYPGTGTRMMRGFLKKIAPTKNLKQKGFDARRPRDLATRQKIFDEIIESIKNDYPVIVHQYWSHSKSRGHYRIIIGFDEKYREIYLLDPRSGEIKQS